MLRAQRPACAVVWISTVYDVMTRDVVSILEFTSYKEVVRVLLEHDISAVPVAFHSRADTSTEKATSGGQHFHTVVFDIRATNLLMGRVWPPRRKPPEAEGLMAVRP